MTARYAPVWSTSIANALISLATENPLTHTQIQKIVYISHGWMLAIHNRRLTTDHPEVWKFGPIYRLIWNNLKYTGPYPVTNPIAQDDMIPYAGARVGTLDPQAREMIGKVYELYGEIPAFKLSALTHKSGTPWQAIYADGMGQDQDIPPSMIRAHFQKIGRIQDPQDLRNQG